MTDRLKPCPFCGGKAEVQQIPEATFDKFVVTCKSRKCCAFYIGYCDEGLYYTKTEAIKAWNTRRPMDRIVEQLAESSKNFCREYALFEDENVLYLPDAIEIVKAGGKDE